MDGVLSQSGRVFLGLCPALVLPTPLPLIDNCCSPETAQLGNKLVQQGLTSTEMLLCPHLLAPPALGMSRASRIHQDPPGTQSSSFSWCFAEEFCQIYAESEALASSYHQAQPSEVGAWQ